MKHKMTKEEAIEILNNVAWLGTNEDRFKTEEAVAMAIQALEDASTIDAVEVVRCKDCKWLRKPYCDKHYCCYPKSDEWFCADGERKEERGVVQCTTI